MFVLTAPTGVGVFVSRTGNSYTVSSTGTIAVKNQDLIDALSAGFVLTGGFSASSIIKRVNAYGGAQNVTQSQVNPLNSLSNGSDTVRTWRQPVSFPQDSYDLRLVYVNAYISAQIIQTGPGNAVTLTAGFEYNGTTVQVTFGGQTSISVPNGGEIVSDTIPMDIPAGSIAYIRIATTVTGGNKWVQGYLGGNGNTYSNNGSDLTTGTGALANSGQGSYVAGVAEVLGSTYPLTSGSIFVAGDSIADGTGDNPIVPNTGIPYIPFGGFIARGLAATGNFPDSRAFVFAPVPGSSVGNWSSLGAAPSYTRAMSHCDYAISNLGTNDIAGYTVPQIQANFLSYWNSFARRGMPVYQATLLPKTTSTDNWRTTANQHPSGLNVTSATNASPIVLGVAATHYLTTGQTLIVYGVGGNTAANGTWTITVVDSTHVSLNGSTGNASYTSGGVACSAESNRIAINDWIRTTPSPLSGFIETANLVEANTANVLTQDGGYWYQTGGALASGTASSGSSSTLVDSSKSWATNQWQNVSVIITGGTGAGQNSLIYSNTGTTLNVGSFSTPPDNTSTYVIQDIPSSDGIHPTPSRHAILAAPVAALAAVLPGKAF